MASKEFKSPRYKFSSVGQYIDSYVRQISDLTSAASGAAKKYFDRLYDMVRKYEEIVLDPDGSILSWNKNFALLEGYGEDEIIGQNFNLFVPPREREARLIERLFEKASKSGTAVYYGQLIRRDGALFAGSIKIVRVKMKGRLLGFVAMCRKLKGQTKESGKFPSQLSPQETINRQGAC